MQTAIALMTWPALRPCSRPWVAPDRREVEHGFWHATTEVRGGRQQGSWPRLTARVTTTSIARSSQGYRADQGAWWPWEPQHPRTRTRARPYIHINRHIHRHIHTHRHTYVQRYRHARRHMRAQGDCTDSRPNPCHERNRAEEAKVDTDSDESWCNQSCTWYGGGNQAEGHP